MINEQELLDKFDRIAEALERMAVAADGSAEAVNYATTARRTLTEQETQQGTIGKKTNEERLKQEKELNAAQQNLLSNTTKLGADLGKLAIKSTFDMFVAGIKGAYAGTIAYQDAMLEGAGANTAAAAQVSAQMEALAGAMEATGSSMVSLGAESAKTALQMIVLGGPLAALTGIIMLLVGAAIAYEGYEKQAQAAKIKRDADLQKKQAAIYDELYKDFTQLSQASLTSAGGMTTLWKQLSQVSMSVKDFGKFNSILKENAQAMATFGSTAIEGVQKFTDIAGSVIRSGFGTIFREMGITNEDMASHTAKFMEQQNRLGLLRTKSDAELRAGTVKYITELDRMAVLTGQSRKEQEQQREAIKQIQQLRAAEFMVRKSGNTEEAERLKAIADVAVQLQRYDPQAAAGLIKQGIGSAIDQDVAYSMRNGGSQTIAAINAGERSTAKLMMTFTEGFDRFLATIAPAMKIQGTIQGYGPEGTGSFDLSELYAGARKAEEEAKAKGKTFDIDKYIDEQRKVTDPFTKAQAAAQQAAKDTQISFEKNVKGLSTEMPNVLGEALKSYLPEAFQKPLQQFLDYIIVFGKAVYNFASHPLDSMKELFYGTKEEQLTNNKKDLLGINQQIKSLKDSSGNVEQAKKTAEKNLQLADVEIQEKITRINTLKEQQRKESDLDKRNTIAKQIIAAENEKKAAIDKKRIALDIADNFTRKTEEGRKLELENLEKKKAVLLKENAELEKQISANPNSSSIGVTSRGGGSSSGGGSASMLSGGSYISTTSSQLAEAGLRLKQGDTQKAGAKIDPRLLEMAKLTQQNVPGFNYFSGFNDVYHQENTPNSRHTKGLAFDFTVNPGRGLNKPTKEHSDLIIDLLKSYGAENVKNEYDDTSGKFRTGGHFHAELPLPKAYDGGIFDGPKGGYPVELHGREAIIPMPNPGDKLSIDRAQQSSSASKGSLSSVMSDSTSSSNGSSILVDLYSMMETKFDDLIDKMDTNNKYTDKILKYSQV